MHSRPLKNWTLMVTWLK